LFYIGVVGVPVTFDGSGSFDPDGDIVAYDWDFGDGTTAPDAGPTPSYTYAATGRYDLILTVTDNEGATAKQGCTVLIGDGNLPPQADAGAPVSGVVGAAVSFDGSGSSDPDGSIVSYFWNFGDGTPDLDAGPTPSHIYSAPGTYLVILTVIDDSNAKDSDVTAAFIEEAGNEPPDCSQAAASINRIWPPNHKFVSVRILGVTDPDGHPVSITIDSIFQDEPVDGPGSGSSSPDGKGVGTDTAMVRAERSGSKKVSGNGRVYHIRFTADDGQGGSCSGLVKVGVPHDKKAVVVDDGANFDSTKIASSPGRLKQTKRK
jgi:PKD repeat protein